jgi:hypothetical protein
MGTQLLYGASEVPYLEHPGVSTMRGTNEAP